MAKVSVIKTKDVATSTSIDNAKTDRVVCMSCHKTKKVSEFFRDNRNDTGTTLYCKKCLIEKALNEETGMLEKSQLLAVLQLIDRPYIHSTWKNIKIKPISEQKKVGEYLRSMGMSYNKNKSFCDSDPEMNLDDEDEQTNEVIFSTEWAGSFTKYDIATLDKKYAGYEQDFTLLAASDKDMAHKCAKASLSLDKCLDMYQRGKCTDQQLQTIKNVYKDLMGTAKFSPSERKEFSVTTFGQKADEIERNIYIYDFTPPESQKDIYDILLEQMANIKKSV